MSDTEKLDLILERLTAIEEKLSKIPTFESMTQLATHEDVTEIAETVNYGIDEILQAEQRRDLEAIRADYRAARAAS